MSKRRCRRNCRRFVEKVVRNLLGCTFVDRQTYEVFGLVLRKESDLVTTEFVSGVTDNPKNELKVPAHICRVFHLQVSVQTELDPGLVRSGKGRTTFELESAGHTGE